MISPILMQMTAASLAEGFSRSNKRSLGQNFLLDDSLCQHIAQQAQQMSAARFLEIGPGAGALTLALLKTGLHCHCLEKDFHCTRYLEKIFGREENFSIQNMDALSDELPPFSYEENEKTVLVSNLPYNVSTQIYFRMIDEALPLLGMVLMFQREVGLRFTAKPSTKSYGILSVLGQYFHDIEEIAEVAPEAFKPQPKVHSLVLAFRPRKRELAVEDEKAFRALVRTAFSQRRKTLANVMQGALGKDKLAWQELLQNMGFLPSVRAEELSLQDFLKLFEKSRS